MVSEKAVDRSIVNHVEWNCLSAKNSVCFSIQPLLRNIKSPMIPMTTATTMTRDRAAMVLRPRQRARYRNRRWVNGSSRGKRGRVGLPPKNGSRSRQQEDQHRSENRLDNNAQG